MNPPARRASAKTAAVVFWIALKVALFVLLGRTETARFVYAGF